VKRFILFSALTALLVGSALAAPYQYFKASMARSTNYLLTPDFRLSEAELLLNGAGGYVVAYFYKDQIQDTMLDSISVRCPAGVKITLKDEHNLPIHQFRINVDDIASEVFITGGS
jgi:hypothetical protein